MGYTWNFKRNEKVWENDEYDTIRECFEAAKREADESQPVVYIGESVRYSPKANCTDILDRFLDDAWEMCGEEYDCDWKPYNRHKKDELEELNNSLTPIICGWLKKYGYYPEFYEIKSIKEYFLYNEIKN